MNKSTIRKVSDVLGGIAYIFEVVISASIIVAIVFLLVNIINEMFFRGGILALSAREFGTLLGSFLSLCVGLEFVKLLARQRMTDLLEVLLMALARQMVVEHMEMRQMLIGVISIAILFAVRKYLLLQNLGRLPKEDVMDELAPEAEENDEEEVTSELAEAIAEAIAEASENAAELAAEAAAEATADILGREHEI